ncbi:ribonuclease H-like domain-containing protein [Tanacetum coccineum]|uniref:Ribonuclease H-like domain-containing protein n=1 Tax=Tanacetum coccineum TaxID=301880 RepID=A0ABQ4Y179_9ASTR
MALSRHRVPGFSESKLGADSTLVCLYMHDPREPHLVALKRILRYVFGYCVFLGNNLLSWSSKSQYTMFRSSVDAEYRDVSNAMVKTSWLRNILRELHSPLHLTTIVYFDNVSGVYLSSNLVHHQRTKYIEINIHFVRDRVAAGHVRVLHVPSPYQYVDIFTKGKDNGENIMNSINEGPFHMGTVSDVIIGGTEGAVQQGGEKWIESRVMKKESVKMGLWTPKEIHLSIFYIAQHGTRNWRMIPKNTSLQRCGESCRLRWTNYLRPNLKHGQFSDAEEQIIVRLHSVLGNRLVGWKSLEQETVVEGNLCDSKVVDEVSRVRLSLLGDRGACCVEFGCQFEVELELCAEHLVMTEEVSGFGIGEVALSTVDLFVLQWFGFLPSNGFHPYLATIDGWACGFVRRDCIGGADCDDEDEECYL